MQSHSFKIFRISFKQQYFCGICSFIGDILSKCYDYKLNPTFRVKNNNKKPIFKNLTFNGNFNTVNYTNKIPVTDSILH